LESKSSDLDETAKGETALLSNLKVWTPTPSPFLNLMTFEITGALS